MNKKHLITLLLFSIFFSGCNKKVEETITPNYKKFSSTDAAIDYSFEIDTNKWNLVENKENNEIELIKFKKDDYDLLFMKNLEISSESSVKKQVKEIPPLMTNTLKKANIEPTQLIVNESYNDYVDNQVYLHNIGIYKNKNYQALFFESSHFLPSISGKIVPNCIICFYDNEKDKKIITQELKNIQNQMIFE